LRHLWLLALLQGASLLPAAAGAAPVATAIPTALPDPRATIEDIATRWVGRFDNHRQVIGNLERGAPEAPELTRERREMHVERLDAPQLGKAVLYYEEFRASQAGRATRQRVVSLVLDSRTQRIRGQQLFFKAGPTYDRKPLDAQTVAQMTLADFDRQPTCDLYFDWEPAQQRYRATMLPRACVYEHEVDGMVYAEFEMLLFPDQLWYRDRSLRLLNGTVRGEIDGFSWLLFERPRTPELARQQGVWRGTFRRYDADGRLTAEFPSEIIARVQAQGDRLVYRQTNRYTPATGPAQVIESAGEVRDGRIWFSNERLDGWAMDIAADDSRRGSLLFMTFKDGSGLYAHEIISCSDDGRQRSRATQYLKDGRLVRRTQIDEEKVTDGWAAYEAQQQRESR
jgi:hypothetical protein